MVLSIIESCAKRPLVATMCNYFCFQYAFCILLDSCLNIYGKCVERKVVTILNTVLKVKLSFVFKNSVCLFFI